MDAESLSSAINVAGVLAGQVSAMTDMPGHAARNEGAGSRILGEGWFGGAAWGAYYGPLSHPVAALCPEADAQIMQVVIATLSKIEIWRHHGDDGNYLTVVKPT